MGSNKSAADMMKKLIHLSKKNTFDVFADMNWPSAMEDRQYWVSSDLQTIYGTELESILSEDEKMKLSKWECINFFSLNANGIKDLICEVVPYMYTKGLEEYSEYLHHFVKEENEHMFYFAKFSLNYGGKVYQNKALRSQIVHKPEANAFLVFAKILAFECLGDFYNLKMAKDEALHPFIREINERHHIDESRHIAFGKKIVTELFAKLKQNCDKVDVDYTIRHLQTYTKGLVEAYYNPGIYRDAGIESPYEFRDQLLGSKARKDYNNDLVANCLKRFIKIGALPEERLF